MKKTIVVSLLLALGCAFTSQAVVIHWAVAAPASGTSSAALVYVASGAPAFTDGSLSNGTELGDRVSGLAVTPAGIGEQATTDATSRSGGAYYVVLFNDLGQYAYSVATADATAITTDAMAPSTGTFNASLDGFSAWAPVPEPSTAMLLVAGAAVAALRRRKRV